MYNLVMTGEIAEHPQQVIPESEDSQLFDLRKRLDSSRPDHQAFSKALDNLYKNRGNHQKEKEELKQDWRSDYYPRVGVEESGFPEVDVLTALDSLRDPHNIFPAIEKALDSKPEDKEYVDIIAETIEEETGIPVVWGEPGHKYNPDEEDDVLANMVPIGDNQYVYCWANEEGYEVYGNQGRVEELVEDHGPTYNDKTFNPTGEPAFILNRSKIDDAHSIQTPMHELGHVVQEKELGKEGEVYPALYGVRTGMSVAKVDAELGAKIIEDTLSLYNWIIYGEVAP